MMDLKRRQLPDKPAKRHSVWGALIAIMITLALVLSAAPKVSADPTDPGQPDPTISATQTDPGDQVDPTGDATADDTATPPVDTAAPPDVSVIPTADDTATASDTIDASKVVWNVDGTKQPNATNGGYIPRTLDTTAIDDASYASGLNKAVTLPAKYDLRTAHPNYLTGVKDQGQWGTCWSFAASEAAEASLVRNGMFTGTESPVVKRQISPLHLVQSVWYNNTFKANSTGCSYYNGYNMGGNDWLAAAAWSHWNGTASEASYPYPLSTTYTCNLPPKISAAGLSTSTSHLNNMWVLPTPYNSSGYSSANVNVIKNAVYTYGTVSTAYAGNMMFSSAYNSTYSSFYDPWGDGSDHAVAIVGWDDNFPASHFNYTPSGNGAFLIQNSWGVGQMDYFWLSYHDTSMYTSAVYDMVKPATSTYRSPTEWTKQYSYDSLGAFGWLHQGTNSITYSNKFTASANTTLRAVQIVTQNPNYKYNISVYTGKIKSNSPITGGKAQALTNGGAKALKGTITYEGYSTITIPKPVVLKKGEKFSIVLTLTAPSGYAALSSLEEQVNFGAGNGNLSISSGQSYMKFGSKWYDLVEVYRQIGATGALGNANIIALTSPAPKLLLTYNANGGTVSPTSKAVAKNAKAGSLAKATRTGYTFKGWYTKAKGGTKFTSSTVMKSDKTIYAQWTAKKYTIKFNASGGSAPKIGSKKTTSKIVTFDKSYGKLPTTKRSGYIFLGWFTSGDVQVTAAMLVKTASNQTLYAHWEAMS